MRLIRKNHEFCRNFDIFIFLDDQMEMFGKNFLKQNFWKFECKIECAVRCSSKVHFLVLVSLENYFHTSLKSLFLQIDEIKICNRLLILDSIFSILFLANSESQLLLIQYLHCSRENKSLWRDLVKKVQWHNSQYFC